LSETNDIRSLKGYRGLLAPLLGGAFVEFVNREYKKVRNTPG